MYKVVEPGPYWEPVEKVYSREDIIKNYFHFWEQKMIDAGREKLISENNCIEDWVAINWAEKV